jgi:hypothetical protein
LRAYNTNSGTGTVATASYKEKITDLLEKAEDEWILKQIYLFAVNMTKEGANK